MNLQRRSQEKLEIDKIDFFKTACQFLIGRLKVTIPTLLSISDLNTISTEFVMPEPDYTEFFTNIVSSISSKVAFERLAKGPRQRADRVQRELSSGETVDIYTVTLHGIAQTGPKIEIAYEELRGSLRKVLAENIPQGHEITRVLSKMDEIAKEELHEVLS